MKPMIAINRLYGDAGLIGCGARTLRGVATHRLPATRKTNSRYTARMQKFGFRIQTSAGMTVENLVIHGVDQQQAEAKLRQMYHRCTILECKVMDELARGDGTDLEGAISLIMGRDKP